MTDKPKGYDIDMSRARTKIWVGQLPKELFKAWQEADGDANLGTFQIITPPKKKEKDGDGSGADGEDEEFEMGVGKLDSVDADGDHVSYNIDLIPTESSDLRMVLSEGSGAQKFAIEGQVSCKTLLYPCQEKKKKDKKKKRTKKEDMISNDFSIEDMNEDHLVKALFSVEEDGSSSKGDASTAKGEKGYGDASVAKDELFNLMRKGKQYSRSELNYHLHQPQTIIDQLLSKYCERIEGPPTDSFRKPKVFYKLKRFYLSGTETEPPPAKRPYL